MKKNNKGIILKIKDIGIIRRYGFNDGSYITVGHYYKNHKEVKGVDDIVFSERGTIAENYCQACGINREDEMHKLIGLEVDIYSEVEDSYGNLYNVDYLTRPFKISEKMGKNKWEGIVSKSELIEDEEEVEV